MRFLFNIKESLYYCKNNIQISLTKGAYTTLACPLYIIWYNLSTKSLSYINAPVLMSYSLKCYTFFIHTGLLHKQNSCYYLKCVYARVITLSKEMHE